MLLSNRLFHSQIKWKIPNIARLDKFSLLILKLDYNRKPKIHTKLNTYLFSFTVTPRCGVSITEQLYVDNSYRSPVNHQFVVRHNFILHVVQPGLAVSLSGDFSLVVAFDCVSFSGPVMNMSKTKWYSYIQSSSCVQKYDILKCWEVEHNNVL